MLSGCILINALYIKSDRLTYISKFIERNHFTELPIQEKLRNEVTSSSMYYMILPLVGGFSVLVLNAFLIYQIFTYGINMRTNLFGTCTIVLISTILVAMQGYVANDISKFPNDKNGLMNSHVNLYIHVMKHALTQNTAAYPIITSIHTLMECCGFYGVDDFYNQARINYYSKKHPKELNTPRLDISNDWIKQCSANASSNNIRRICIAPRFCCRDPSNRTCSSVIWTGNENLHQTTSIFDRPCLPAMVHNFRSQVLSILFSSMGIFLTGILYLTRLLQWKFVLKASNEAPIQSSKR